MQVRDSGSSTVHSFPGAVCKVLRVALNPTEDGLIQRVQSFSQREEALRDMGGTCDTASLNFSQGSLE